MRISTATITQATAAQPKLAPPQTPYARYDGPMQNEVSHRFTKRALALLVLAVPAFGAPVHLRTNALVNPIGIDSAHPTFSWRNDATTPNWMQSGYQILIATDAAHLAPGKADLWDSGKVASSESVNIAYAGPALKSQQHYLWKVLVWDAHNTQTPSPTAFFETGLLTPSDWKANWITRNDPAAAQELAAIRFLWLPGADPTHVPSGAPAQFRYTLHLDAVPAAATLHVLARGNYIAHVNGTVTGHHDEWGAFDREPIAALLHPGDNEILIDMKAHRDDAPATSGAAALAASIRLTAADGKQTRIVSDEKWEARPSAASAWKPAAEAGPITADFSMGTDRQQAVPGPDRIATEASLLRKAFTLPAAIQSARLTITALGAYQASLNGKPIGPNTLLAPGWTDFHKRVLYQTYDVTPMLVRGGNTLGVLLGGGWYSSPMTWSGFPQLPRPKPAARAARHHPRQRHPPDHRHRLHLAHRTRARHLLRDLRRRILRRAPLQPQLEHRRQQQDQHLDPGHHRQPARRPRPHRPA